MKSYRHSGTLGDLIYSLSIVKKLANDDVDFKIALHNIENCVSQYGYRPDEVDPAHKGRFTKVDAELLRPLLERQSYIKQVSTWSRGDAAPDVDLDLFRGTLFRGFEGNYVQAYHIAFGLPFTMADYDTPWLDADPIRVKPIVVSRTPRYRGTEPDASATHAQMAIDGQLEHNGIFVGTEAEHKDYVKTTGINIEHFKVSHFLDLANVIAGADLVIANQNFVYSLAIGLGKQTVLETIKIKPLQNNECFFPRSNCQYF